MTEDERTAHTLAGLLTRLRASDPSEDLRARLDAAFAKHTTALHTLCRRELRGFSEQQVEDAVHGVLEIAWKKLPEYRRDARFKTFLWGIALRHCAGIRRKRRDEVRDDEFFADIEDAGARSALATLVDKERGELVEEASRNVLDARQQELVHMRLVLDYAPEDVAATLGYADADEVRKRLFAAKRTLERELRRLIAEKGITSSA